MGSGSRSSSSYGLDSSLLPVWFVEPTAEDKRRSLARARTRRKSDIESEFDMNEVKRTLLDIREDALNNFPKYERALKSNLAKNYNINVSSAETSLDAVDTLNEILGDIGTVAINHSSTVREVISNLPEDTDLNFFDSYTAALESSLGGGIPDELRSEMNIQGYWDFVSHNPVQIWNSFNIEPSLKGYYRSESPFIPGDYAALMGINTLTADGNLFLLQHLQNMTNVLANAKKAVFVVGLEKLVKGYEQGVFQTRCSALFGYETILLDLMGSDNTAQPKTIGNVSKNKKAPSRMQEKRTKSGVRKRTGKKGLDESFIEFSLPAEVHVIILDNGRKELLDTNFKEILRCIGCKACSRLCPRTRHNPAVSKPNARDIIMSAFTHSLEYARDHGLFDCTLCRNCHELCPVDIPLQDYLYDLRKACERENIMPDVHERLYNNIRDYSTPYGAK
jgi:L-lactate utilization protein LutB